MISTIRYYIYQALHAWSQRAKGHITGQLQAEFWASLPPRRSMEKQRQTILYHRIQLTTIWAAYKLTAYEKYAEQRFLSFRVTMAKGGSLFGWQHSLGPPGRCPRGLVGWNLFRVRRAIAPLSCSWRRCILWWACRVKPNLSPLSILLLLQRLCCLHPSHPTTLLFCLIAHQTSLPFWLVTSWQNPVC